MSHGSLYQSLSWTLQTRIGRNYCHKVTVALAFPNYLSCSFGNSRPFDPYSAWKKKNINSKIAKTSKLLIMKPIYQTTVSARKCKVSKKRYLRSRFPLLKKLNLLKTHCVFSTQSVHSFFYFNPFNTNIPFLYPLKSSENVILSDIFRGYSSVKWVNVMNYLLILKPLRANPTKCSNTTKQFVGSCRRIECVWPFCGVLLLKG